MPGVVGGKKTGPMPGVVGGKKAGRGAPRPGQTETRSQTKMRVSFGWMTPAAPRLP